MLERLLAKQASFNHGRTSEEGMKGVALQRRIKVCRGLVTAKAKDCRFYLRDGGCGGTDLVLLDLGHDSIDSRTAKISLHAELVRKEMLSSRCYRIRPPTRSEQRGRC